MDEVPALQDEIDVLREILRYLKVLGRFEVRTSVVYYYSMRIER